MGAGRIIFSPWTCAAGTLGLPALMLVGLHWWPEKVVNSMVALDFALAAPCWINVLTNGWARRAFSSARYQLGWLPVYALIMAAAVGTRLQWPSQLSVASAILALTLAVALTVGEVARRRRLAR